MRDDYFFSFFLEKIGAIVLMINDDALLKHTPVLRSKYMIELDRIVMMQTRIVPSPENKT
jgi:hypothetical protein